MPCRRRLVSGSAPERRQVARAAESRAESLGLTQALPTMVAKARSQTGSLLQPYAPYAGAKHSGTQPFLPDRRGSLSPMVVHHPGVNILSWLNVFAPHLGIALGPQHRADAAQLYERSI